MKKAIKYPKEDIKETNSKKKIKKLNQRKIKE